MKTIDEIRTAEYLLRAAPETVYEWFKAWPQRTPEFAFFGGNDVPEEIQQKLLARKNEIIDLALAAWGTNSETIGTLYQRWCARSVVTDWPPQPSTYPYAVLASILANANTHIFWSRSLESTGIPTEDFDWLIEHSDDGLFRLMHDNIALGFGLLLRCAAKSGAYGQIDGNRWLFALGMLGYNKSLHRIDETDNEGPDLLHSDIHKAFVQAAIVSPKTSTAASVLGRLFGELPSAATKGAYVSEEALAAAVLAWNVEIPDDDDDKYNPLKFYHEFDALTPAERVQFHLLRHYCLYLHLDPDDPVRVRRLAAYAQNPVNGGKGWGLGDENQLQKYTGKGLDIKSFQKYSDRDGPAFVYATSLNCNIWSNKDASEEMEMCRETLPKPEDTDEIYRNRQKCVEDAAAEKLLEASDTIKKSDPMESRTLTTIGEVRKELGQAQNLLNAQIRNLKKWLIWGGIIVVVLVLFRH